MEKLSRSSFKQQLATAIRTSSVFTAGTALPGFCITAFNAVFTQKIWSVRGVLRSFTASAITVTLLLGVWYSSIPGGWRLRIVDFPTGTINPHAPAWWALAALKSEPSTCPFDINEHGQIFTTATISAALTCSEQLSITSLFALFIIPLVYNFFADYIAIVFTKRILTHLAQSDTVALRRLVATFLLSAAFILAISTAVLGVVLATTRYIDIHSTLPVPLSPESPATPKNFVAAILFPFYRMYPELLGGWTVDTIYGVFIWSTLMGVAWLGVFSVTVIIANISMKLGGLGPWLDQKFKVRSEPFRILMTLAMILTLALCLFYHLLF